MESNQRIRGFLEPGVELKDALEGKPGVFSRIGYALHALNPVFREISFNDSIKVMIFM